MKYMYLCLDMGMLTWLSLSSETTAFDKTDPVTSTKGLRKGRFISAHGPEGSFGPCLLGLMCLWRVSWFWQSVIWNTQQTGNRDKEERTIKKISLIFPHPIPYPPPPPPQWPLQTQFRKFPEPPQQSHHIKTESFFHTHVSWRVYVLSKSQHHTDTCTSL